jgi:phenylalanyl-tRNA synthetase beta chain
MLVSYSWLTDYLSLELSPEDLAARLTMAGLNLESLHPVDGDTAIDLEVTSNRPDCLGHIGIAREAGVLTGHPIKIPPAQLAAPAGDSPVTVKIDCLDLCPQYVARVIRGVTIAPSPDWLQQRLRTIGLTPVNNVVDVTNYVLMECGQPLHAFDFDRLAGGRIRVRRAKPGETILAIDHHEYDLTPDTCMICDAERPVAIGGVMGGAGTEISAGTTNLLIEVANFQPLSIHHTARRLKLHSPSSHRFERGVDAQQLDWASRRCCELILQTAGGAVEAGAVIAGKVPTWKPQPITLRFTQLPRVLGIDVPADDCLRILTALGVELIGKPTKNSARFRPPSWRRDLTREIDLIEEVARIHGYDRIPEDRVIPTVAGTRSKERRVEDRVRDVLTAVGFCEAVTFTFTHDATYEMFTPRPDAERMTITPAAGDFGDVLRQSAVPSLVLARRDNARRGNVNAELFEIARVFVRSDPNRPEHQPRTIGLVSGRSFPELRGVADSVARAVNRDARVAVRSSGVAQFMAGRGAELTLDGERWGWIGELDRDHAALRDLKLRDAVTVLDLDLQRLIDVAKLVPQVRPIPQYPAVARDFNFVLDEAVTWEQLEGTVRRAGGPTLEGVSFVEQYRGKHIPAGKKSYVLSISYRAPDRTLTSEEVDAAQQSVIEACARELSAALR